MSHTVEDGFAMVDAVHKANRIMQVGSQRVSSIVYEKAPNCIRLAHSAMCFSSKARRTAIRPAVLGFIPFSDAKRATID